MLGLTYVSIMTDALMSELKVSSREFSLAPSVTLSFEYAQRVAGIRRQGCSGLSASHRVSLATAQLFVQNKIHRADRVIC